MFTSSFQSDICRGFTEKNVPEDNKVAPRTAMLSCLLFRKKTDIIQIFSTTPVTNNFYTLVHLEFD